ncbi:unnamed protein product [Lupinus luteus]|uniref:Hpc2-related domain-containing protein n=1 Tax=Lupinus luteus TaxID=3873 RepID=A0AAV1XCW3_LUPLU
MVEQNKPPSSPFVRNGHRQMFTVELRPGETTIVSWKKFMKDANNYKNKNGGNNNGPTSSVPPHVHPSLEPKIVPVNPLFPSYYVFHSSKGYPAEVEEKDPSQPNRFSAVIEKIEGLLSCTEIVTINGKDSSDEEDMCDVPDDDQYDTDDSFIDDAELDKYFEVHNSAIKHDGFFVNRGKLECINEPPVLPNQQPKKRHRKYISKNADENNDDQGSSKQVKVSRPASGKTDSLKGKNTSNSTQNLVPPGEHYKDLKVQNQFDVLGISSKKKTVDTKTTLDPSVSLKAPKNDVPAAVKGAKDADKQKTGVKKISDKYKDSSGLLVASHQKYHEKGALAHSKSQPGRSSSNIDDLKNTSNSKEKKVMRELPDLNLSEGKSSMQATKSEYTHKKDGSSVRPKTSTLEKAIRELEKMVVESRPPAVENQEADTTSQAVKRRLPREIKLKLAKVARLAQASQGKVSKELLNRLMSILGHLMQLRTLKRNLKEMISTGLSAKQEKDVRFQQIKKEVVDLIRIQAPTLETKGLDEGAGPEMRKLYAEIYGQMVAWTTMGSRRRVLSKDKDQEKMKRNKLLVPKPEDNVLADTSSVAPQQSSREKVASQSHSHAFTPVNKSVSNMSTPARVSSRSMNDLKQEKAKKSSSSSQDNVKVENGGSTRKKVKRKPERNLDGEHFRPEKKKLGSLQGETRPKSLKHSAGLPTKSKLQPTIIRGVEQSS